MLVIDFVLGIHEEGWPTLDESVKYLIPGIVRPVLKIARKLKLCNT